MSKAKKTRQQKVIADLRRKLQTTTPSLPTATPKEAVIEKRQSTYSFEKPVNTTAPAAHKTITIKPSEIMQDLTKTSLVTGSILAAQLILFFLLKQHILKIPGLQF